MTSNQLKICRLCFKQERNSEELFFGIDDVIQKKFFVLTTKKLVLNDKYPKKICCSCYAEFENYYLYRNGLIDKQRQLDKFATSNKNNSEESANKTEVLKNTEIEQDDFNEMDYTEDHEIPEESYEDSSDAVGNKMCSLCGQEKNDTQLSPHICQDSLGSQEQSHITISESISIPAPDIPIEFLSFERYSQPVKTEPVQQPTQYTPLINNELKNLLMQTEVGKSLLNKRNHSLENSDRGKITQIIADFFINHQRKGSGHLFREWSAMITEIFPDELQDSYYRPAITIMNSGKRFPKRATGKLPDAFYNRHSSIKRMSKNDKAPLKKF